jgi:integrase
MNIEVRINVDDAKAASLLDKLGPALDGPLPEPLRAAFRRDEVIYMAFIRRRFVNAARGDGTWLPLANSTKINRLRKTKKGEAKFQQTLKRIARGGLKPTNVRALATLELSGSSFEILRDTGILFNSLSEGGAGNVQELLDHGIRMGTRVIYAHHHQEPAIPGRPPQRTIIVEPDPATLERMTAEITHGIDQVLAGLSQ